MKRHGIAVGVLLVLSAGLAADEPGKVRDELDKARVRYETDTEKARAALLAEFDKRIESAKGAGKLEVVEELESQKDDYLAKDVLPTAKPMDLGNVRYKNAIRRTKGAFAAALKRAEAGFTKAGVRDEAKAILRERLDITKELEAEAGQNANNAAPDALFQPDSRWTGKVTARTIQKNGKVRNAVNNVEILITSVERDTDTFTARFTSYATTAGGQDSIGDIKGKLGRLGAINPPGESTPGAMGKGPGRVGSPGTRSILPLAGLPGGTETTGTLTLVAPP